MKTCRPSPSTTSSNTNRQRHYDHGVSANPPSYPSGGNGASSSRAHIRLQLAEPTMRSITLVSPSTTGLDSVHELGSGPLAITRPPTLKSRSKVAPVGISIRPNTHAGEFQRSKVDFSGNSKWKVSHKALECVPDHFVLERTSRFISGVDASIVSARISDCLRSKSIEATYDNAKAKAKCRNVDLVKFRIRLYSGQGEYSHGVIVEVQRRSGPSLSFLRDCRAVLDSAQDSKEDAVSNDASPMDLCPVSDLKCLKTYRENMKINKKPTQEQHGASNALNIAFGLLQKNHLDASLLGMENLSSLTDPKKTNNEVALNAAKSIFSNENVEILNILSTLLQNCNTPIDNEEDSEYDYNGAIRNAALLVVSNSLYMMSRKDADYLLDVLEKQQEWILNELLPVLINDLKQARCSPHDAFLAARGLNALLRFSAEAKSKAHEIGALDVLVEANEFGVENHASLAKESGHCALILECH